MLVFAVEVRGVESLPLSVLPVYLGGREQVVSHTVGMRVHIRTLIDGVVVSIC